MWDYIFLSWHIENTLVLVLIINFDNSYSALGLYFRLVLKHSSIIDVITLEYLEF
jgi:hypothetical protein